VALFGRRRDDPLEVRRILKQLARREPRLGWTRRLATPALDRLVAEVESDLAGNPTRDSLLEHVARLHFDTRARARVRGRLEDADSARCAIESVIFERRYGESVQDALGGHETVEDEWERAHLYVEGELRRLGLEPRYVAPGHWVHEAFGLVVHLHHYPGLRVLDLYAPLAPVPSDDERGELFAELLAENGGSLAGAFYGVCSFGASGDFVCACGRVATSQLTGAELTYVLSSIVALAESYAE
jgi:hypothetical protein